MNDQRFVEWSATRLPSLSTTIARWPCGPIGRVVQATHPIGPHGHRAIVVDSEGNRVALHSTKR